MRRWGQGQELQEHGSEKGKGKPSPPQHCCHSGLDHFALKKKTYGCMCMYENQDACVDKIDTSFRVAVSSEQGEDWSAI